jgi:alcohol dehydrogenase
MVHYARLLAAHNPYEMDNDAPKDPNDSVNDDANNSLFLMSLGVALSAPGIGAALAYAIHARFPVDKAQCSTILLPLVIERLISVRPEKIAKVAALLGEPTEGLSVADSAHALLSAMKTRIAERTESTKLKDCKLVLDRLVPVAESARNLEFIAYSPWTITSESVFELLKAVF